MVVGTCGRWQLWPLAALVVGSSGRWQLWPSTPIVIGIQVGLVSSSATVGGNYVTACDDCWYLLPFGINDYMELCSWQRCSLVTLAVDRYWWLLAAVTGQSQNISSDLFFSGGQ